MIKYTDILKHKKVRDIEACCYLPPNFGFSKKTSTGRLGLGPSTEYTFVVFVNPVGDLMS